MTAASEAKLGSTEIPKAETNLLRLANDKVDVSEVGPPAFLAIVTGTEAAYTLPSGVHVIPLAALTWWLRIGRLVEDSEKMTEDYPRPGYSSA